MRKKLWAGATTLALCLALAACAPQGQTSSPANQDGEGPSEPAATTENGVEQGASEAGAAAAEGSVEEFIQSKLDALEAREEAYAPEIRTLADGTMIQRTPTGNDAGLIFNHKTTSYNNYYLNADNRGCMATGCHSDLALLSENITDFAHPKMTNEMGIEATVQQCILCHGSTGTIKEPDAFGSLIHGLHDQRNLGFQEAGGDCMSCHVQTQNGLELWDTAKHEVLRGITKIAEDKLEGDFSYNQDKTLSADELFDFPWINRDNDYARWARHEVLPAPDPETDGVYDQWTITVSGEVDNPVTLTINEWIDAVGLDDAVITAHCSANPTGGNLIGNYKITGLDVLKMLDYAGVKDTATACYGIAYDGWMTGTESEGRETTVPLDWMNQYGVYLVLQVDGETLSYEGGYPAQLWAAGASANMYGKEIRELKVTSGDTLNPNYGLKFKWDDKKAYIGRPNVGIAELSEGEIIPAGQTHTFEGYAFATSATIDAMEFSFDQGATWKSFPVEDNDLTRWTWWNFDWTPPAPGAYTISARAIDGEGEVTEYPVEIMFNVQ